MEEITYILPSKNKKEWEQGDDNLSLKKKRLTKKGDDNLPLKKKTKKWLRRFQQNGLNLKD